MRQDLRPVLNGTTRINGSAFYYDYSDYQAFRFFVGVGGLVINKDADNLWGKSRFKRHTQKVNDIILSDLTSMRRSKMSL